MVLRDRGGEWRRRFRDRSRAAKGRREDVFEMIASLAPGSRSKADIDRQIKEERSSWGDR